MKKLLFLAFATCSLVASAQNPKNARVNANLSYDAYYNTVMLGKPDPVQLDDAKKNIDIAAKDAEVGADIKTWETLGRVYSAIGNDQVMSKQFPNCWSVVDQSLNKVMELDVKKKYKSEVKEMLMVKTGYPLGLAAGLFNSAVEGLNTQKYDEALANLTKIMDAKSKVSAHLEGKLKEEDWKAQTNINMTDVQYYAGIAASASGKADLMEKYWLPILADKSTDPKRAAKIYSDIANFYMKNDKAKAKEYLTKGRAAFPDDVNLILSSIQLAMDEGRLAESEADLVAVINKDDKNANLKFVLGNVYDNLSQKFDKEGNTAEAQKYFDKALEWYNKAATQKPDMVNAHYNIGAMYYNKASNMYKTVEAISDMKAYNAKRKELDGPIKENGDMAMKYLMKTNEVVATLPADAPEKKCDYVSSLAGAIRSCYVILRDNANVAVWQAKVKELECK